jgi:ketosteroid isomerase-like protein
VDDLNVQRVRELNAAFNARDIATMKSGCDPEVEIHSYLQFRGGAYRGHQGLREWLADVEDAFEGFESEIEEIVAVGDERVWDHCVIRTRGAASGASIDREIWHVTTFREGKVVRWESYFDEQSANAAAGRA